MGTPRASAMRSNVSIVGFYSEKKPLPVVVIERSEAIQTKTGGVEPGVATAVVETRHAPSLHVRDRCHRVFHFQFSLDCLFNYLSSHKVAGAAEPINGYRSYRPLLASLFTLPCAERHRK
jgi:hypothetical protein